MMPMPLLSSRRRRRPTLSSSLAYAAEVLADTPIAYYRLGDSSGISAVDSSGNGNDGTYAPSSGGAWTGGTLGVSGISGGGGDTAATFNGSSGYVSCGTLGTFGSSWGSGVSVECWFKSGNTTAKRLFGTSLASSKMGFTLLLNNSENGVATAGKIRCIITDNSATAKLLIAANSTAFSFNDSDWHHVVATFAPPTNTITLCIDGSLQSITYFLQQTPVTFANLTQAVYFGALNNNGTASQFYDNAIDEFALYAGVLSSTRAAAHYAAGI